jgi:hypothetical protein
MSDRIIFVEAWISGDAHDATTAVTESTREKRPLPSLDMAAILDRAQGRTIELLHIDALGAEGDFIASMGRAPKTSVRFLVDSTHHRSISGLVDTHEECFDLIRSFGGHILVAHNVQESFSGDGLLVAFFFEQDRSLPMPTITRNTPAASLFPEP